MDIKDCSINIDGLTLGDCDRGIDSSVGGDQCDMPIGCQDYEKLNNLPKINGVELVGDRSSSEIHVQHEMDRITEQMIDNIIY